MVMKNGNSLVQCLLEGEIFVDNMILLLILMLSSNFSSHLQMAYSLFIACQEEASILLEGHFICTAFIKKRF